MFGNNAKYYLVFLHFFQYLYIVKQMQSKRPLNTDNKCKVKQPAQQLTN